MPLPLWAKTSRDDGALSSLFAPGSATSETGVNVEPVVASWLFPDTLLALGMSAQSNLQAAISRWEGWTSNVALSTTVDGSSADLYESLDNDYGGTTDLTITMGASQTRDIKFYAPALPGSLWTADLLRVNMWIAPAAGHSGTGWNYQPFCARVRDGVTQATVFGGTFTNVTPNAWLQGTVTGLTAGLGTFGASDGFLHGWRITTSASPANPTSIMVLNHPTYSLMSAAWAGTGQNKHVLSLPLTVQSNVTATAVRVVTASAAHTVQSSLTASADVGAGNTAALTVESNLTATATRVVPATSPLTFQSTFTSTAIRVQPGTATFTAQSNTTVNAIRVQPGTATFTAQSTFTSAAIRVTLGGSTLTFQTAWAGSALIVRDGAAALTGQSNLTASGSIAFAAQSNLSIQSTLGALAAPIYRLILPTRSITRTRHPLLGRVEESMGVALLLKDGVGKLKKYPSDFELTAADSYWLGGYNNPISSTERAAVVAAGFGGLIEEA